MIPVAGAMQAVTPAAAPDPIPAPAPPSVPVSQAVALPVHNPQLRLDAALNLVVIEFRDAGGDLQNSIPSPRELDAYRISVRDDGSDASPRLDVSG